MRTGKNGKEEVNEGKRKLRLAQTEAPRHDERDSKYRKMMECKMIRLFIILPSSSFFCILILCALVPLCENSLCWAEETFGGPLGWLMRAKKQL